MFCCSAGAAIYVSGAGSDATGDGSEANPYRSLTHAIASRGTDTEIRAAAGSYDAANGEAFPIAVPGGVSITGTRGADDTAATSSVVDAGGTARMFDLSAMGTLRNLVMTGALGNTVAATSCTLTIDNCVITNVTDAAVTEFASAIYCPKTVLNLLNTTIRDITTPSARHIVGIGQSGSKLTVSGCAFRNLRCGGGNYGDGILTMGWEYFGGTGGMVSATISDTVFDNIYSAQTWRPDGGMVIIWDVPFTVERCVFRNITCPYYVLNYRGWGGYIVNVRDSLFYNNQTGDFGSANRDSGPIVLRNCTFDNCSTVSRIERSDAKL